MNEFLLEKFSRVKYKDYLNQYEIDKLRKRSKYSLDKLDIFYNDIQIESKISQ